MLDVGHSIQDSAIVNGQDVTMANPMTDSVLWPMVSSEDLRMGNLPVNSQESGCHNGQHNGFMMVSNHLKISQLETCLVSEKETGKHCTKGDQPDQQAGAACHQIHHLANQ